MCGKSIPRAIFILIGLSFCLPALAKDPDPGATDHRARLGIEPTEKVTPDLVRAKTAAAMKWLETSGLDPDARAAAMDSFIESNRTISRSLAETATAATAPGSIPRPAYAFNPFTYLDPFATLGIRRDDPEALKTLTGRRRELEAWIGNTLDLNGGEKAVARRNIERAYATLVNTAEREAVLRRLAEADAARARQERLDEKQQNNVLLPAEESLLDVIREEKGEPYGELSTELTLQIIEQQRSKPFLKELVKLLKDPGHASNRAAEALGINRLELPPFITHAILQRLANDGKYDPTHLKQIFKFRDLTADQWRQLGEVTYANGANEDAQDFLRKLLKDKAKPGALPFPLDAEGMRALEVAATAIGKFSPNGHAENTWALALLDRDGIPTAIHEAALKGLDVKKLSSVTRMFGELADFAARLLKRNPQAATAMVEGLGDPDRRAFFMEVWKRLHKPKLPVRRAPADPAGLAAAARVRELAGALPDQEIFRLLTDAVSTFGLHCADG